jgi:hypothetical protein
MGRPCECCRPVATTEFGPTEEGFFGHVCFQSCFSFPVRTTFYPENDSSLNPIRVYHVRDTSLDNHATSVNSERAGRVLDWVERGGRLVVDLCFYRWKQFSDPEPPFHGGHDFFCNTGSESVAIQAFGRFNDLMGLLGAGMTASPREWFTTSDATPEGSSCNAGNHIPDQGNVWGAVVGVPGESVYCGDPGNRWGDVPLTAGLDVPFSFGSSSYIAGGQTLVTVMGASDVGAAIERVGNGCILAVTGHNFVSGQCNQNLPHPFDPYDVNRELFQRLLRDNIDEIVT